MATGRTVTVVAFHFNAPDKLAYACEFAAHALRQGGASIVVHGSPQLLTRFDRMLWGLSATDFWPHCFADAPQTVVQSSPVVLASDLREAPTRSLLLQLAQVVPEGFAGFETVVEVVDASDVADRAGARERWRHYTRAGQTIERLDLAASP